MKEALAGKLTIDGKLTISRFSQTAGQGEIEIQVQDVSSSVSYCTVRVSFANFAQALTGLGRVECEHTPSGLHLVGKRRENKSIGVHIPSKLLNAIKSNPRQYRQPIEDENFLKVKAIIDVYCVDGWKVFGYENLTNFHYRKKVDENTESVSITFVRYVDAED